MIRFYLSDNLGTGTLANPWRSAVADLLPSVPRAELWGGAGRRLVRADVSDAQHAILAADARLTFLPFVKADGTPLGWDETLSEVPLANRNQLTTIADAHHIPIQGLTLQSTLRECIARFRRRFHLRRWLGLDDWSEGLDTLVSAIPLAKRQRIATALQNRGFDTSVIQGSDTIREAIRKIVVQSPTSFRW